MISILAFIVLICVLVFVHEYGHFWAARKCGVNVIRFSIGFGKVLWRRKDRQGTEFVFSLIPLGGYVQMFNGEAEYHLPIEQSLQNKTILQRAFIIIAGPVANFLFAIVAYWVVFSVGIPTIKPVVDSVVAGSIADNAHIPNDFEIKQIAGKSVLDWEEASLVLIDNIGNQTVEVEGEIIGQHFPITISLDLSKWQLGDPQVSPLKTLGIKPKVTVIEPIIKEIVENTPAAKAGLKAGDQILKINQHNFDWEYLINQVQTGHQIVLTVEQQGKIAEITLIPERSKDGRYLIGVIPMYQPLADIYRTTLKYDILTGLTKSVDKVSGLIVSIWQFIGNLITGHLSLNNIGSPISIAKGAGAMADIGWIYYLGFMALISVNLGVMNLFPILPLDGGQLLLLVIQVIRGKALPDNVQLRFQQLGIAFVLGLMALTLFNDLIHF